MDEVRAALESYWANDGPKGAPKQTTLATNVKQTAAATTKAPAALSTKEADQKTTTKRR